jgi:hypothetical protein
MFIPIWKNVILFGNPKSARSHQGSTFEKVRPCITVCIKEKRPPVNVFPSVMVNSTDEPPPPNAGPDPLAWESLAFHPLGLYDLRRHLGKLPRKAGIYNAYRDRFNYSDLAWFAPGLAKRPTVETDRNSFHAEYLELRLDLIKSPTATEKRADLRKKIQALTFDCVSCSLWFYRH